MSKEDSNDSGHSSPESSAPSESQIVAGNSSSSRKRSGKLVKPRLTLVQKNTNHKDAENKRRNAIRERFTELSRMVPGAEGQERSEQVMLGKTAEFLKEMLKEQRRLEDVAASQGIFVDDKDKLKDNDYGGSKWRPKNIESYEAAKAKKGDPSLNSRNADEEDY